MGPLLTSPDFGYEAVFFVHLLLALPTLLMMHRFLPDPTRPHTRARSTAPVAGLRARPEAQLSIGEGLKLVASNRHAVIFFSLIFVLGVSSGVIENFAYVRLREVGASGSVLGSLRFISSVAGLPMFFFAGAISKRLTVIGVLLLSLLAYVARFVIYANLKSAWWGLPAELLRGSTFAAMWAAATSYTHSISPPGLTATMLGILNGMYGGLGQSIGSLLGGGLQAKLGTSQTFLICAAVDVGLLALFVTISLRMVATDRHRRDRARRISLAAAE